MTGFNANQGSELNSIGREQYNQGQYEQAEETWQQALIIARGSHDRILEADILNNLGLVRKSRGEYFESLILYQQSLSIYRQRNNLEAQADVLDNLGFVYYQIAQYFEALENYQAALTIHINTGNRRREILSLQSIIAASTNLLNTFNSDLEANLLTNLEGFLPHDDFGRP